MTNQSNTTRDISVNEIVAEESADVTGVEMDLEAETADIRRRSMRDYTRRWRRTNVDFNGQLGGTQPTYLHDVNQLQTPYVASPNDLFQIDDIADQFSATVTEDFPGPRESEGEQCTIITDGASEYPVELPHDTDFSNDSHEHQNRTDIDTASMDEQRLAPEVTTDSDNNTDEPVHAEIESNVTQTIANTNDTIDDQSTITEHNTNEQDAILTTGNTFVITEVKNDVPLFSRTVSNEGTVLN